MTQLQITEQIFTEQQIEIKKYLKDDFKNTLWLLDNLERYLDNAEFIDKCITTIFKNIHFVNKTYNVGYYRKKKYIGEIRSIIKKRYTKLFMITNSEPIYNFKENTVKYKYKYMTVKNFILNQILYEIEHTSYSFEKINTAMECLLFEKL